MQRSARHMVCTPLGGERLLFGLENQGKAYLIP